MLGMDLAKKVSPVSNRIWADLGDLNWYSKVSLKICYGTFNLNNLL